ncbi:MAG: NUDIX hydrolase [Thiogranum sp.]|nr:NUDIX hydrolase [Thiogranum sp.]
MSMPVTPALTVDVIIEMQDRPHSPVVLIERRNPPYGWALPGGFVDMGERLETAAIREAREEISLDVQLITLLGCYSDPDRDTRGHTVSAVYIGVAKGEPKAQDDARNLALFDPEKCPELAFDHGLIMADYLRYRQSGQTAPLRY